MVRKVQSQVVLAKVESSYGVDASPTGGDALLAEQADPDVDPETLTRDNIRESLSNQEHVTGRLLQTVQFTTELKTHGSAYDGDSTDPIPLDPLFRACGMSVTYNAESSAGADDGSIVYEPVSNNFESITLYIYKDGVLHKLTGCYGTFSIDLTAGEFGKITWEFTGLYNTPVDQTAPSTSVTSQKPEKFHNANLTLDDGTAYNAIAEQLQISENAEISERPDANSAEGLKGLTFVDRSIEGSLDPEAVKEATYDFFQKLEDGTAVKLSTTFGSAGNQVKIEAPKVQEQNVSYGDRDNILTYDTPLNFAEDTGDDELKITFS